MDYDFTIVYQPDDFYLADTIRRELEKRGKKCLFGCEIAKGWKLGSSYISQSPIFIAIVNSEFINSIKLKSVIATNQKEKGVDATYVLTSEPNLNMPEEWTNVDIIDVCSGLNLSILETVMTAAPAPQTAAQPAKAAAIPSKVTPSASKATPTPSPEVVAQDSDDDDGWDLQRHSTPSMAELILTDNQTELTMTVQRAIRYLTGDGVPQDAERTVALLTKATEENPEDAVALYYLGVCAETGINGNPEANAAEFYRKATNLGHMPSLVRLAFNLSDENKDEAVSLLKQAREKGVVAASYGLGLIAERAEKFDDAVEYYSEAAELGNAAAQNALACLYSEGNGVSESVERAIQWFELAADQGSIDAMANLGVILLMVSDDQAKKERGEQLLRNATSEGNAEAARIVGMLDEQIKQARIEKAKAERRRRAAAENEQNGSGFLSSLVNDVDWKGLGGYAVDRLFRGN